jgi:hypothetical protein
MSIRHNVQQIGKTDPLQLMLSFEKLRKKATELDHLKDFYAALEGIAEATDNEKKLLELTGSILNASEKDKEALTVAHEGFIDTIREAAKAAKDFTTNILFNIRSSKGRVIKLKVMHHEVTKASGHASVEMPLKALGVLRTSSAMVRSTTELKTRTKAFCTVANKTIDFFESIEKVVAKDFKKTVEELKSEPRSINPAIKEALIDSFTVNMPEAIKSTFVDTGNTIKEGYRIAQYYGTLGGHTLHVRFAKKFIGLSKQKVITAQALSEYLDTLTVDYELLESLDKTTNVTVNLTDVLDILDMVETMLEKIEKYSDSKKSFYSVYEYIQMQEYLKEDSQASSDALDIAKNTNELLSSDIPVVIDSYSKVLHGLLTTCYSMLLSGEWYEQKFI